MVYYRFAAAIVLAEELMFKLEDEDYVRDSIGSIVIKHDPRNVFSQRFISGVLDFQEIIGFHVDDTSTSVLDLDIQELKQNWISVLLKKKRHLEYWRQRVVAAV
jgi:hypothetical protein